jgi:hypothetical protein
MTLSNQVKKAENFLSVKVRLVQVLILFSISLCLCSSRCSWSRTFPICSTRSKRLHPPDSPHGTRA